MSNTKPKLTQIRSKIVTMTVRSRIALEEIDQLIAMGGEGDTGTIEAATESVKGSSTGVLSDLKRYNSGQG